jgi:1,4-alpha-glucan branching enzyme
MIIVFAGIFQFQKKNNLVQYANTTSGESTITVRINFHAPEAKKVAIAGDFNKWKVDENILKRQDNGIWTIEIPLKPGAYNYMFVVDGKVWMTDPNAELYQDDGFGFKNSVLKVTKL